MNHFLRAAMARAQKAHEERLVTRDLDSLPDAPAKLGGTRVSIRNTNAHGLGRGAAPPISTCMAILRARREGVEVDALAERFGVTTRTIQRLTKRAEALSPKEQ